MNPLRLLILAVYLSASFSFPSLFTYMQTYRLNRIKSLLFVAITFFWKQFARNWALRSQIFMLKILENKFLRKTSFWTRRLGHAISCAISRQKNACCTNIGYIARFIRYSSHRRAEIWLPYITPQGEYGRAEYANVNNQIFSDGLFTKHSYPWSSAGARLARSRAPLWLVAWVEKVCWTKPWFHL